MVKRFETTTQTGEDVHVTLANNTVIIRFPVEGEEEEWAKTEHRHDWFMGPDIDEQFEDAVIEAVRLPDESREDGEYKGIDITLTNAAGETVNFATTHNLDDGWGRIYGPWYGKAPAASVVA